MIPVSVFTTSHYSFDGKRDNERVEIFLYRHWITLGLKLIFHTFLVFLPLAFIVLFGDFILSNHLGTIVFFVACLYFMLLWSSAFFAITMYLLDTWIVTNERVIDMRQHGFFSRTVSDMSIDKIQDISVDVKGFIPTLLKFGNIEIQSAGATEKFIFKQVAHPQEVKDAIMDIIESNKKTHPALIKE